jgi:hypothetical protein
VQVIDKISLPKAQYFTNISLSEVQKMLLLSDFARKSIHKKNPRHLFRQRGPLQLCKDY